MAKTCYYMAEIGYTPALFPFPPPLFLWKLFHSSVILPKYRVSSPNKQQVLFCISGARYRAKRNWKVGAKELYLGLEIQVRGPECVSVNEKNGGWACRGAGTGGLRCRELTSLGPEVTWTSQLWESSRYLSAAKAKGGEGGGRGRQMTSVVISAVLRHRGFKHPGAAELWSECCF